MIEMPVREQNRRRRICAEMLPSPITDPARGKRQPGVHQAPRSVARRDPEKIDEPDAQSADSGRHRVERDDLVLGNRYFVHHPVNASGMPTQLGTFHVLCFRCVAATSRNAYHQTDSQQQFPGAVMPSIPISDGVSFTGNAELAPWSSLAKYAAGNCRAFSPRRPTSRAGKCSLSTTPPCIRSTPGFPSPGPSTSAAARPP